TCQLTRTSTAGPPSSYSIRNASQTRTARKPFCAFDPATTRMGRPNGHIGTRGTGFGAPADASGYVRFVPIDYEDLPDWTFTVTERSAGAYRCRATREGGVVGETSGTDPEALLADLRQWARGVEDDLGSRG